MAGSASTDDITAHRDPASFSGSCTTSTNVDSDDGDRLRTGFGCSRCRPACLRFLVGPRWFLLFASLSVFCMSLVVNGLLGVNISTIERRFALSSSQTAWIAGTYEVAGAPALIAIGYLGLSLHRPAWIGGGLVFLGVGFGIFSFPHFAAPPYRYADVGNSDNLCSVAWNTSSTSDRCTTGEEDAGDVSKYLAAFVVAMIFQGLGGVPLYVLGVTYLDDASPRGTASVHIGIFYAFAVMGPVVAFVCGGFLLRLYTHFDVVDSSRITLKHNDPRWVGAWWVGYLAVMVVTLTVAPVFFGYPPEPSTEHYREKSTSSRSSSSSRATHELALDLRTGGLAGVAKRLKCLATNGPLVLIVLYGTSDAVIVNGTVSFGAKFVQLQFGLTTSMAGIAFGVVAVPGVVSGFLLSSILIKRLSLTTGQLLRAMFLLAVLCLGSTLCYAVQCDTAPLADLSTHRDDTRHSAAPEGGETSNTSCGSTCSCAVEWFQPVCGDDGLTYFSPCYAGCRKLLGESEYGNCSCVGDVSTSTSDVRSTAVEGVCDVTSCHTWRLVVFFILFFIAMSVIFVCQIFHLSCLLRVVDDSDRPFAFAIDYLFQRILGGLPGQVLFGAAIDHSCVLWEKKCDGSTGACLYYDNHETAWLLLAICAACKVLNIACGLIAWRLYVRRYGEDDRPRTAAAYMLSLQQTGNVLPGYNYGFTEDDADRHVR